jgi:Flp pilus assembly protein TadG/uncharacterized protein YegL
MVNHAKNVDTEQAKASIAVVRLLSDRSGNFGIMTALLVPLLCGAAGVALDLTNMMAAKASLQGIADAASLATSSNLSEKGISTAAAREMANTWVKTLAAQDASGIAADDIRSDADIRTTGRSDGGKSYDVAVSASYTLELSPFMRFLGKETAEISVRSASRGETTVRNALSMYFVLDKSGSMMNSTTSVKSLTASCNRYYMPNTSTLYNLGPMKPCMYTQMEALQNSADSLFDILDENDKDEKYIRSGAVSYNASAQPPSPLAWGRSASRSYVKDLIAEGGTSSTKAFEKAYESLVDTMEDTVHKNKNGLTPKKFILFMTDGTNSASSDDGKTLALCQKAKDADIKVYTVAFNAPVAAKLFLMKCATDPTTYFDAVDATALSVAFQTIGRNATGLPTRLTR